MHKYVSISSANKEAGSSVDFSYRIPNFNYLEYDHVSCLQFLMLKTFYMSVTGNNTFTLSEDAVDYTITMPVGNYSRSSIASTVEAQLNASASASTFTVTYAAPLTVDDAKFTFSSDNAAAATTTSLTFDGIEPAHLFGFTDGTFVFDASFELKSENVINLQKESTFILSCNRVPDSFLQEIYGYNSISYSTVSFSNPDPIGTAKNLIGGGSLIHFKITDEVGIVIPDLNGTDVVFSLVFWKEEHNVSQIFFKRAIELLVDVANTLDDIKARLGPPQGKPI